MLEWHASAVARSHAPLFLDCKWHGVKQSDSLDINALNKCCEPTGNAMPARLMTQTQKHWKGQSQLVAITCHSKWKLSKWGKYPTQCHTIELSEWVSLVSSGLWRTPSPPWLYRDGPGGTKWNRVPGMIKSSLSPKWHRAALLGFLTAQIKNDDHPQ